MSERRFEAARLRPRIAAGIFGCGVAAVVAVYLTLALAPAVGMFHDDGVYLVTAKGLAEDKGYRISSLPAEPPQTKYPVLFPWLISLVWRLVPSFPANLPWLRLVPLVATLAWLCLSWSLLRRLGASQYEAAAIVLLIGVSPWVAFLSTALMTETLFAALLTGGLLLVTRIRQGQGTRAHALFAGWLAGAAVLTRIAGLAFAGAGLVTLVAARRWIASGLYLAGMTITLPWFWWVAHQRLAAAAIDPYYSAVNYESWNIVASYAWTEKLDVLATNAFLAGLAPLQMWGVALSHPLLLFSSVAAVLAVVSRGLWHARSQPAVAALLAYSLIHAVWVWPPLRFAVPVLPLVLWFAYVGTGRSRRLGCIVALTLLSIGAFRLSEVVTQAREKRAAWPITGAEDWNQTARLLNWIANETPNDAVLTGNLDPMYYLFTGRKAVRAFSADPFRLYYNARGSENPLGTVDDFRDRLLATKADYLIMTPSPLFGEVVHLRRLIAGLSQDAAGSLLPVAGGVASGYVIYRIDRYRLESARVANGSR